MDDPSWKYGTIESIEGKLDGEWQLVDTSVEPSGTRDELHDPDAKSIEIVGDVSTDDIARHIEVLMHA
jgi:hypothetical protein